MPGQTATRQMLNRTADQSGVKWRHAGDLLTGRVEPGRTQPGRQHPVCGSAADRNCVEPTSLTGFNAGVLRVGDPSRNPDHPRYGRINGVRIVGACTPGHPAYSSCVRNGTAGDPSADPNMPGSGRGSASIGYVGDGTNSPGNQLGTALRTLADPYALRGAVSRQVNNEINRIRADPMRLLNYLPR